MWNIQTESLIYESKANLDEKILFGKITYIKGPTISKMPLRGLCGNREFHIPFWSMIDLAFKFNAIVTFRNEFQLQYIASKSRTRMEYGILVPIPYKPHSYMFLFFVSIT